MTNPTADAAKLLPSEEDMKALVIHAGSNWERDIIERLYQLAKENTRPQPAPLEGEPDLHFLEDRAFHVGRLRGCAKVCATGQANIREIAEILQATALWLDRLGLAATEPVNDKR